jgi:hypothetical protein
MSCSQEYTATFRYRFVGQDWHENTVAVEARDPSIAFDRAVAGVKHLYVMACSDPSGGGWRSASFQVSLSGHPGVRKFKMTPKAGRARIVAWSDFRRGYCVMLSQGFLDNPLDEHTFNQVMAQVIAAVPPDTAAVGKPWSARVSTPFVDLYVHIDPIFMEITLHYAGEDQAFDAAALDQIKEREPDFAATQAAFDQAREAWRAARH